MTKQKALAIAGVLGIAALVLSAGTLAYFTDHTKTITNTFTVGKVDISLTEPEEDNWKTDENGKPKMVVMPGGSYAKTPTITVEEGSEKAWVFAGIKLSNAEEFKASVVASNNLADASEATNDQIFAEFKKFFNTASTWRIVDADLDTGSVMIMYYKAIAAGTSVKAFSKVTVPTTLDDDAVAGGAFSNSTIDVKAYAIQAAGIKQADAFDKATAEGLFGEEAEGDGGITVGGDPMTEED